MKTLCANDATIFTFDKQHPAKLTVNPGDKIAITTKDCFSNLVDEQNTLATLDWNQINPATGPIYVKDAQKGDILKVTIHSIELVDQGVCAVGPGFGLVPIEKMTQKIIPIREQQAIFSENIHLPLNPMIGVIGVAPEGEAISTGTPDAHGGNMDTTLIKEGAILYFPIFTEGALFALGDLHAVMGDGEIGGSGLEIAGTVIVTLDLTKAADSELKIAHPIIETDDHFAFIVSRETIDQAIIDATNIGVYHLQRALNISLEDATMLGSLACQAEISQLVDPQLTARFMVPKTLLPKLF
ncbi:MAG TPA: acetamidase/formamidase family protein [Candidatus Ignatzschineria merdigallinarum]|uniref:Acetamidase/formamidase family protein n=1 Tax=Candidatus Ignatzschineria merdigallinarum TaxID=2838621 RepID=A0A9D1Q7G0_9GAMM|nr:acetamidase/formamidase family protein [Candidatus Ignatzschineria merdigallinarum]